MTKLASSPAIARGIEPWIIALLFAALLMLVATIFYPFGYDQAVFSTAGDMILHGAMPYRDFLDTKPPVIYYIYALALWIFGHHEFSAHAFDIFWQIFAALYFFRILRRYLATDQSLVAVSLMLVAYAGSGFWMTAQAESFAILPSLVLLDSTLRSVEGRKGTIIWGVIAGVAALALFALKFTLALGGVASLVFVLGWPAANGGKKLRFVAGFLGAALVLLGLGGVALWEVSAWKPFLHSLAWLSNYASLVPTQHSWLAEFLLIFPERIVYSMSITVAFIGLLALIEWFRKPGSRRDPLFKLLLLTFLLQLLGIVLERKIEFPYQYARATWAVLPFAASAILVSVKRYWSCSTWRRCAVSGSLLIVMLLLSPLARVATQSIPWSWIAITGRNASAEVQRRVPDYYAEDQHAVAKYLNEHMTNSDHVFLWGNDVAIYFFANRLPQTICLTATPLRTPFSPEDWKSALLNELRASPPKYWIVESGDARPAITGSPLDSYQALLQWAKLNDLLQMNYLPDTTIGHFALFRHR